MKEGENEQKKIKSERQREVREKYNETKRERKIERGKERMERADTVLNVFTTQRSDKNCDGDCQS